MAVTIRGVDAVSRSLNTTLEKEIQRLAQAVESAARENTPRKTGFTRTKWSKQVSKQDFVVENKVPWIEKLEAGASRQAPKGIIGPTLSQIKGKRR
jgi:hypothetical protein